MAVVLTVLFWTGLPIIKIIEQDKFYILDFRVPMYFIKEPFTRNFFVYAILFQVICAPNVIAKKSCIDFYVIHMITLVTSEYHYISDELENLFEEKNNLEITVNLKINDKKYVYDEKIIDDKLRLKKLKQLIEHHSSVTK